MRRLRLLWVTPNLPQRGIAAARERWWALLARLATRHDITLVALLDPEDAGVDPARVLPPGLAAVHTVAKAPWPPDDPLALLPRTVRWGYAHPAFRAAVAERLAADRFDLVQYEYTELDHVVPPTDVPTILTVAQLGFAAPGPAWRAAGGGLASGAVALYRHLRDLDFELRAVARARHVITMSAEDAARLHRFLPTLPVSVSPVGIDCAHFHPAAVAPAPATDVLFVGHFDHPPNRDAVRFLVADVLPRLGQPAHVRIVGQGMTPEITALARPGVVEIAGAVPDVRPHLAAARVVVAPVRFGTGMRGKVLEALAMARPVVSTALGAEGLAATPGRDLLVANGADAFARAVRHVLDDPGLSAHLGAAGRALAEARFDWDAIAAAHDHIYEQVLRARRAPAAVPADRAAILARWVAPFGRLPGAATGAALLAARGLRWYLRGATG
jgi:glycosyltransferase involved in cell wall biosynthesis